MWFGLLGLPESQTKNWEWDWNLGKIWAGRNGIFIPPPPPRLFQDPQKSYRELRDVLNSPLWRKRFQKVPFTLAPNRQNVEPEETSCVFKFIQISVDGAWIWPPLGLSCWISAEQKVQVLKTRKKFLWWLSPNNGIWARFSAFFLSWAN